LGYKWEIPITFITCNDLKTVNQRWLRTHDDHIELTFPSGPFFTQSKIVRVLLVALGQGDHIGRFFFLLGICLQWAFFITKVYRKFGYFFPQVQKFVLILTLKGIG
jgi:hypothetical protein